MINTQQLQVTKTQKCHLLQNLEIDPQSGKKLQKIDSKNKKTINMIKKKVERGKDRNLQKHFRAKLMYLRACPY